VNTDTTTSWKTYMQTRVKWVEAALREWLPDEWNVPQKLREAMEYSLHAGGKRIRPVLALAACEAFGGNGRAALPAACAIEMIHTYSLIHDDLPAMDNDDYRRGRLTNHKVFGEAMAILAGDGLLTHAFYAAARTSRESGVDPAAALAIVEELSLYAGAHGMVGGQAADMLGEQGLTKLEELEYIHLRKTSDLIVFALRAGGRIGGASGAQLDALARYGTCIGLAFQIQDDILDLTGDEAKLGKPLRSDEQQGKVTYPYFIGLERSKELVERLTEDGKSALMEANIPAPGRLIELADYLMKRDR
jgi:geranylgeranyl diphosphate synthase, type II